MPSDEFYVSFGLVTLFVIVFGGVFTFADSSSVPPVARVIGNFVIFGGIIMILVMVGAGVYDGYKRIKDWKISEDYERLDREEREEGLKERRNRKKRTRKDEDRLEYIKGFSKKTSSYTHQKTSKENSHSLNYVPESSLKPTYPKGFELTKPNMSTEKIILDKSTLESFRAVPEELRKNESTSEAPLVFISHSILDKEILDTLVFTLKSDEINYYVAEHDKDYGHSLSNKIETEIDASEVFVVIITKASSLSSSVSQEIGYAKKARKRIIPLIESGVDMPIFLQGIKYVEFTSTNLYDKCQEIAISIRSNFGKFKSEQTVKKFGSSKTIESNISEINESTFNDQDYEEFIKDSLELKSLWSLRKYPKKYLTRNQLYKSFSEQVDRSKTFYKSIDKLIELGLIKKMDEKQYLSKNKETFKIELTPLGFRLVLQARKEKITSWNKFQEKYLE